MTTVYLVKQTYDVYKGQSHKTFTDNIRVFKTRASAERFVHVQKMMDEDDELVGIGIINVVYDIEQLDMVD